MYDAATASTAAVHYGVGLVGGGGGGGDVADLMDDVVGITEFTGIPQVVVGV